MACCSPSLHRKRNLFSFCLFILASLYQLPCVARTLPRASEVVIVFMVKWSKGLLLWGGVCRPFRQHGAKNTQALENECGAVATPSLHYYTGRTQNCKTEHRFMLSQSRMCPSIVTKERRIGGNLHLYLYKAYKSSLTCTVENRTHAKEEERENTVLVNRV